EQSMRLRDRQPRSSPDPAVSMPAHYSAGARPPAGGTDGRVWRAPRENAPAPDRSSLRTNPECAAPEWKIRGPRLRNVPPPPSRPRPKDFARKALTSNTRKKTAVLQDASKDYDKHSGGKT